MEATEVMVTAPKLLFLTIPRVPAALCYMKVFLPPNAGDPVKVACGTNHCLVVTDKHELYT